MCYPKAGGAFMLTILPWEQNEKLQVRCMKNFFITCISYTRTVELQNVYGTTEGHRHPFAKLPLLSTVFFSC